MVGRYINLVYSTALRRVNGNSQLAQEVAQSVFTDLARKAGSLRRQTVLAGWLHRASRYAAAQLLRGENRRRMREQEAAAMNAMKSESAPDWEGIRPLLDEALDHLNPADRDALLLRFFEQKSLAEVGRALGSNEDAARKRVGRALERLRAHLVRRGVTTTAGALSAAISANAVQIAPAGLAVTLASASLIGVTASSTGILAFAKLMSMTKLQLAAVGALLAAGIATPLLLERDSRARLRTENDLLRGQIAQLQNDNEDLSNRVAGLSRPTWSAPAGARHAH